MDEIAIFGIYLGVVVGSWGVNLLYIVSKRAIDAIGTDI